MLATVHGVRDFLTAGKAGLLVLAILFVVTILLTELIYAARRRRRGAARRDPIGFKRTPVPLDGPAPVPLLLPAPGPAAEVERPKRIRPAAARRIQVVRAYRLRRAAATGATALLLAVSPLALLGAAALLDSISALAASLCVPPALLFVLGYRLRRRRIGRILCFVSIWAVPLIPLFLHSLLASPFASFAVSSGVAAGLSFLLAVHLHRAKAREEGWNAIEEKLRTESEACQGKTGVGRGDGIRRSNKADSIEASQKVKARGMYFRIP